MKGRGRRGRVGRNGRRKVGREREKQREKEGEKGRLRGRRQDTPFRATPPGTHFLQPSSTFNGPIIQL
jgi:hypothetical protein